MIVDEILDKYKDRLRNVLDNIRIELERFSWHCSKITKLGENGFSIAVSKDPTHLVRDGEPDEYDFEVQVLMLFAHPEDSEEVSNAKAKIDIIPFKGPPIFYKFIDSLFPDTSFHILSPEDLEKTIEDSMKELEAIEPYDIVKMVQKWLKGKLPHMQK